MSTAGRVAITVFTTLLLGAYTYANAFDLDRDGTLATIAYSPVAGWALVVLLVLTVALVNRWWALSPALVPFAVLFYLHEATDYDYPYHEDPYPGLVLTGTVFLLAIASLGFVLRLFVMRIRETLLASQPRA